MRVAVVGNIGAGKTTLAEALSKELKLTLFGEPLKDNPFLIPLYEDMKRWAFHTEQFFLWNFIKKIKDADNFIIDRHPYETPYIFAKNMHNQGILTDLEYELHLQMLEVVDVLIPPFDYIFYLNTNPEECMKRIKDRFEKLPKDDESYDKRKAEVEGISPIYLTQLNDLYVKWRYDNGFNEKIVTIDGEMPTEKQVKIILSIIKHKPTN